MSDKLLQASIVIVGTGFSPSNLDPISLSERNIVPQEWEWVVAGNMTTPVASAVTYENGVSIVNEATKFQVTEPAIAELRNSKGIEIAKNYVSKFTQIGYTAVGINFHVIVPMSGTNTFIQQHFLKESLLRAAPNQLQQVGLRLIYSIDGGTLRINVDEGKAEQTVEGKTESYTGLLFVANHHRVCTERPAGKQVLKFLNLMDGDWDNLRVIISSLVGSVQ